MQYEIMIVSIGHLILNVQEKNIYKENGGNLIDCLVVDTGNILADYPDPVKEHFDFFNLYYYKMLDASVCFNDKNIKLLLEKYCPKLKYSSDYSSMDWKTHDKVFNKFIGVKLLVEEIEIIDHRDECDEEYPGYKPDVDFFNPEYYEPDDWEFVFKVNEIL